jgi:hypothetical protein
MGTAATKQSASDTEDDDDDSDSDSGLTMKERGVALPRALASVLLNAAARARREAPTTNASPPALPVGPFSHAVYVLPTHIMALAVLRYLYCQLEASIEHVEANVDCTLFVLAWLRCAVSC